MCQPSSRAWIRAVGVFALIAGLAGGSPAPTGAQQQALRLPGLSGGELTEADLGRGSSVLVLYAGWSPRCRDVVDRANALHQEWGNSARVAMINFQESPEEVRAFLRDKSPRSPVYLDRDGAFAKKHSVTQLPFVLVFRDGEVKARGRLDDGAGGLVGNALR
jgi:thiol-disulfide isomerase/thioredoxin